MAPSGKQSPKDSYKSTIQMSHPTLKPVTNFKERAKGSSAVPVPPELHLP
jgi:hypothetical protein